MCPVYLEGGPVTVAQTTLNPDPLWGVTELSDYVGVPKQTIYSWHTRGRGPRAIRVGKYLRYRRSDVDAWLEQNADDEI